MTRHPGLHKWVHRIAGGSAALAGSLMALQSVDMSPLFGMEAAAKMLAGTGLFIAGLEFLPVLDEWIADDDGAVASTVDPKPAST